MVGKSFSTHLEDLNCLIVEKVNIKVNVAVTHNRSTQYRLVSISSMQLQLVVFFVMYSNSKIH